MPDWKCLYEEKEKNRENISIEEDGTKTEGAIPQLQMEYLFFTTLLLSGSKEDTVCAQRSYSLKTQRKTKRRRTKYNIQAE